mmetsp:Transcript_11606/g.34402  ORF Transcript_11606/g.34402 Transcript_11606/m.34402 type:complete len:255 (-) Transcript_11606:2475-3239(-)
MPRSLMPKRSIPSPRQASSGRRPWATPGTACTCSPSRRARSRTRRPSQRRVPSATGALRWKPFILVLTRASQRMGRPSCRASSSSRPRSTSWLCPRGSSTPCASAKPSHTAPSRSSSPAPRRSPRASPLCHRTPQQTPSHACAWAWRETAKASPCSSPWSSPRHAPGARGSLAPRTRSWPRPPSAWVSSRSSQRASSSSLRARWPRQTIQPTPCPTPWTSVAKRRLSRSRRRGMCPPSSLWMASSPPCGTSSRP